ncbi:YdcF family protein [Dyella nitratireducens]|uniref:Membrane protein n=1 Tax=Dyella nitratireducens TaxID=1849580 RepID=A0ABQ1FJU8_9GAMM|nr:YdcF family protein [Dyella nitratireducens]GGA17286.1 membrane protein [Dyella nitratireducens]GLQ44810.1 membrane protein [Dyella nitratireducens]
MLLLLLFLLCVLGYVLVRFRRGRGGWVCYGLAFVLFAASGCGLLPDWLLTHLQAPYATRPTVTWAPRNAIVVLGIGTSRVPATGQVGPMMFAGNRLIEGYRLYHACKQTGSDCKLIVSGGDPLRYGEAEAKVYGDVLTSMGVDRADLMLETHSLNTWQNAQFVQPMIKAYAPQHTVLVTSAVHMRRAQTFFEHFGMDALLVRADYVNARPTWLPNGWNMALTEMALHEYVGVLTYHIYNALGWNAPPSRYGAP